MKRAVKALVAVVLIALLLWGVDWDQTRQLLARVSIPALGLVLGVMVLEILTSTWKWSWTLRMHQLSFRFGYLLQVMAQGYFANNFLPTAIGGDAYRAYRTMPQDNFKSRAVSAVLLERVTGMLALLFIGAVGALVMWNQTVIARWYIGIGVAGTIVAAALAFITWRGWLKPITNRVRHLAAFQALEHNLDHLLRARGEWVYIVALSLVYQLTSVTIIYWLFLQVGRPTAFTECAMIAAVTGVAGVLPISISGIGVVEGALVGVAVALGIEYESALLVSILRRSLILALSVLCGVSYMFSTGTGEVGAPVRDS